MNSQQLNALAKRIHKQNHCWWHDLKTGKPISRNKGELLMLVITELAESVEGIRKNLMDDHLPHRRMEEVEMADAKIRLLDFSGGFHIPLRVERADIFSFQSDNKADQILSICNCICRCRLVTRESDLAEVFFLSLAIGLIDRYCELHRLDIDGALKEKLAYNRKRADHKPENRIKANGKKF